MEVRQRRRDVDKQLGGRGGAERGRVARRGGVGGGAAVGEQRAQRAGLAELVGRRGEEGGASVSC